MIVFSFVKIKNKGYFYYIENPCEEKAIKYLQNRYELVLSLTSLVIFWDNGVDMKCEMIFLVTRGVKYLELIEAEISCFMQ